jgi:hypothetical protein
MQTRTQKKLPALTALSLTAAKRQDDPSKYPRPMSCAHVTAPGLGRATHGRRARPLGLVRSRVVWSWWPLGALGQL